VVPLRPVAVEAGCSRRTSVDDDSPKNTNKPQLRYVKGQQKLRAGPPQALFNLVI